MSNQGKYQEKYLKYKEKYIQLKQQQGGASSKPYVLPGNKTVLLSQSANIYSQLSLIVIIFTCLVSKLSCLQLLNIKNIITIFILVLFV